MNRFGISSILVALAMVVLAGTAVAQTTYTVNAHMNQGQNPGGLNTESDATSTGWTQIIVGPQSLNVWSSTQAIPFAFNFYGQAVTQYRVSQNGVLTFDAASTTLPGANDNLPSVNLPDNSICVFWDDFTASPPTASGDNVISQTFGTAPNRQHWVKWFSFEIGNPVRSFVYMAVVLEETTNKVYVVDYSYYTGTGTTTVGVQLNSTEATQFGTNTLDFSQTSSTAITNNGWYEFTPITLVNQFEVNPGTTSGLAAANDTDLVVADFDVFARHTANQDLNGLTVTHTGSVAAGDLTNLKLWHDQNSNGALDMGEPQLGSTVAGLTGSSATFGGTPLLALTASTGADLLVTADVGVGVTAGQTIVLELTASTDVTASPGPIAGTFPVSGGTGRVIVTYSSTLPYLEDFDGGSLSANVRVTTAPGMYPTATSVGGTTSSGAQSAMALGFISGISIGNTSALSGTSFFHTAYNTGGAAAALDFLFDLSAYDANTQKLELRLWWIDDGMDVLAANTPFDHVFISVDGGASWLTAMYAFDMSGTVAVWTEAVVDVSAALVAAGSNYTNRVIIRLQAAENLSSDIFNYEDVSLREVPSSLEVGGRALPNQSSFAVSPTGDIVVLAPTLTANLVNRVVSEITITNSGTVADADIIAVKLWEDTNGNALLDGADTQIGTNQTFTGGAATFQSLVLNVTTGAPVHLLVTYEFAAGASGTIGCSIDSAADVVAAPTPVLPQFPQTFPIEATLGDLVAPVVVLPYSENFDGTISGNVSAATAPGSYPTATAVGGTTSIGVSANPGLLSVGGTFLGTVPNSGSNQAIFNWNNLSNATLGLDFHFDLSAYDANNDQIELRFAWNDEGLDSVAASLPFDYVFISTDGGVTWLTALFYLDPTLVTSTTANVYASEVVDVSQVLRSISANFTSNVVIRFQVNDDDDLDAMLLDDVELVYVAPTAPTVAAPMSTGGQATEVLTGVTEATATSSGHPINTFYHDQRMESIYLASELTAAGIAGGSPITEVHLRVAQLPGRDIADFRIRMQHTSNSTISAFSTTGFTDVYGPTTLPITGFTVDAWFVFTLTTPFVWNGTDNLVVDFTTDGTGFTTGGGIYVRNAGASRSRTGYADSAVASPYPFDNITNQAARAYVPSIRFKSTSIPFLTIAGANPNYTGTVDLGGDLNFRVEADDVNTIGTLTWTVTDLGTGSLTAAQAGFDQTFTAGVYNDPNPNQPPMHSLIMTGVAADTGTIDLEIEVTDGTFTTTITLSITIQVGTPLIRVRNAGSMAFFTYSIGTPSVFSVGYELSGYSLTGNLDVTAPTDFQVSTQPTSGFGAGVSLPPTGPNGVVAATTIYVRYLPTTASPHAASITNASTGAGSVTVPVTGDIIPAAPPVLDTPRTPYAGSPILITEWDSATDHLEIQNVSGSSFDATGWRVVISDTPYTNPSSSNPITQPLGVFAANEIRFWNDTAGANYWGNNIFWDTTAFVANGWIMIIDDTGAMRDFVVWGLTAAEISAMSVNAAGFTGITVGNQWLGDGLLFTAGNPNGQERAGNTDHNDSTDWQGFTTGSTFGATNPSLTVPFGSVGVGGIKLTGSAPNFTGTCFVTDSLELTFGVTDTNALETQTFTVTVIGGTLTAAQAGFTQVFTGGVYTDPAPAVAPHSLQLTGIAAMAGTINLQIDVSDGLFTETQFVDLTIQDIPTVTLSNLPADPFFAPSGSASPEKQYTVQGAALLSDITIDATPGFEISLTTGTGFSNQLILAPTAGVVAPTTVFVRYNPTGFGQGTGQISHTIDIGQRKTLGVVGYVGPHPSLTITNAPLPIMSTTAFGTPSDEVTFNVSGNGVVGNVTVTAPAGFEVSRTAGTGFGPTVVLPLINGSFPLTTVFVRFVPATGSAQTQTGTIQVSTLGPASTNVAVEGRVVSPGTGDGGGGGSDGGGGGCAGGQGRAPWMLLAGGLAILLIAFRRRRIA